MKVLVMATGIAEEAARGLLKYVGEGDHVVAVFLDDGKYASEKEGVLRGVETMCKMIGAHFHRIGVKPPAYSLGELHERVVSIGSKDIVLSMVTGPRMINILLLKYLEELGRSGFSVKILMGVEGEGISHEIPVEALTTSASDLGKTQKKILKLLAREEMTVEEISKKLGIARMTIYKSLERLKERGLIEGRVGYRATVIGRILSLFGD